MWNQLLRLQPSITRSIADSSKSSLILSQIRNMGNQPPRNSQSFNTKLKSTLYYAAGLGVLTVGLSYAAVPLYRMFCAAYSYGGTTGVGHDGEKVESMKRVADRIIKIKFNADISASMRWNFKPQQYEIKVAPGETALAFYQATNPTDRPVIGISTYNVIPFEAGAYFNKIQCFCFEEQQLNPHEEVRNSESHQTELTILDFSCRWTCRCSSTSTPTSSTTQKWSSSTRSRCRTHFSSPKTE
jgi:cytochrome c oxidase assembly protein Cox11